MALKYRYELALIMEKGKEDRIGLIKTKIENGLQQNTLRRLPSKNARNTRRNS